MNSLTDCQNRLNYQYKNPDLLEKALIHRSFLNENRKIEESNERLEFLGDAVLELVTSQFLYLNHPDFPEGKLTALRAKIVQTKTLAKIANKLELGENLKLSKGETASGGHQNISILADLVESIIGSIYLDGGYQAAQGFIKTNILSEYESLIQDASVEDYKSQLQENIQSQGEPAPIYNVIKEEGPDHDKMFTIEVHFHDQTQASGTGKSKQAAQQAAARRALEKFQSIK
jgi:ribonuclease III